MSKITIPHEALEAAARADYENWRDMYAVRGDTLEWEDIEPQLQNEHRSGVTAAIRAALAAWPDATILETVPLMSILLPLPQENTDAEG